MTCCKNLKLSFETTSAFKKDYKFQWKKTPTALSYKMLETKKTNTFSKKSNFTMKDQ